MSPDPYFPRVRHYVIIAFTICTLLLPRSSNGDDPMIEKRALLNRSFSKADSLFKKYNTDYAARTASFSKGMPKFELKAAYAEPAKFIANVPLTVQVDAESMQLVEAFDYECFKNLKGRKEQQRMPTLSIQDSLVKAQGYLREMDFKIGDEVQLKRVSFNRGYASCWELRWTRVAGPYPWDDFDPTVFESVYVIFHEQLGLIAVGRNIYSPEPKSLEVRLTSEQAIATASPMVAAIQRSKPYLATRPPGFVASGVDSCKLKVAVPNWLHDPRRAVWPRDAVPVETRLCWRVIFNTMDSVHEDSSAVRQIAVFVDARSGEVVGGGFD